MYVKLCNIKTKVQKISFLQDLVACFFMKGRMFWIRNLHIWKKKCTFVSLIRTITMLQLGKINHIAIICSDYPRSLAFYRDVLGFHLIDEEYRVERHSMLSRLALGECYMVELFTFPDSPARLSYPEACGLRHLAFGVSDIEKSLAELDRMNIPHEPLRETSNGGRCCFLHDPDGLPIELVEDSINS